MATKSSRLRYHHEVDAEQDGVSWPLHYTARAGLLAELSRQTYDSLYKALREAILNGIDAAATRIDLTFGPSIQTDELVVEDDGEGMDLDGLRQSFMSLGGSAKYADSSKFGRIGIGSLALLTYAREAVIETKQTGTDRVVEARLYHPQTLDRDQRAQPLSEFAAGLVSELSYAGRAQDHFTRVRLIGLNPEVREVVDDPTAFYRLMDQLRRVLPLPLTESRVLSVLSGQDRDLVDVLRTHAAEWSVPVFVRSTFHPGFELTRRGFGDRPDETWTGRIEPIHKTLRVVRPGERREIVVAGFLLGQQKASPDWSGLTARVQNVAVEEHTFFDVTSDPGFRKYITGEVFLLGDIDTDRLININRTSFNRESRDYGLIQRFMSTEIERFKRARVSQPQREKVGIRRMLEERKRLLGAIERVVDHARQSVRSGAGLPSSNNGSVCTSEIQDFVVELQEEGIDVMVDDALRNATGYSIVTPEQGDRLQVRIGLDLAVPSVAVGDREYTLVFRRSAATEAPVVIKNRPRQIVFNLNHPAVSEHALSTRAPVALALELAYLLPTADDVELYDRLLRYVEAL
jgi:hypothetical protein